jgi:hypothetical protein
VSQTMSKSRASVCNPAAELDTSTGSNLDSCSRNRRRCHSFHAAFGLGPAPNGGRPRRSSITEPYGARSPASTGSSQRRQERWHTCPVRWTRARERDTRRE